MFNPIASSMKGVDSIASILDASYKKATTALAFDVQSNMYNPKTEWLSFGNDINETGDNYTYGEGSHTIRLLNFISPDIMLVHQSRMVGFYIKLNKNREVRPVQRDIKNLLLKDVRY